MKLSNYLWKIFYIIVITVLIFSYFQKKSLPEVNEIKPELFNEPVQTETDREDFNFDYRGKDYHIIPQADYELWGLVVSQNNIAGWFNYYTDEDSVNLKDICVVWGDNLKSGAYRDPNISYKSGEFTCYYRWYGRLEKPFNPHQLSNNHLLTADENIQDIIRDVRIGDQVRVKGSLVDYAEAGTDWYRRTSLTRQDNNHSSRGAGACEVFYADEVEILKKNQPAANELYYYGKRVFAFLIVLQLLVFFIGVHFSVKPRS
jgi:hypothetical protein